MTNEEVRKLQPGDEVYWNDPDEGNCSRWYTIQTIVLHGGEIVRITDRMGNSLECFSEELT